MKVIIRNKHLGDTILEFQKKDEEYKLTNSENDINDLMSSVIAPLVNGDVNYQLLKPEYREEYDRMKAEGCLILCLPSEWSYSKQYKNLEPKDAILIHSMILGFGDEFFIDGEKISSNETLEEIEARLMSFEVKKD